MCVCVLYIYKKFGMNVSNNDVDLSLSQVPDK